MDEFRALNHKKIAEALEMLVRYPPHLLEHTALLKVSTIMEESMRSRCSS
jgi:hypothetical protein